MAPHTLASASYGKDLVRILRVVREPSDPSCHRIAEYTVRCLLSGQSLVPSYTEADNSPVVATDSIKNTLNLLAKTLPGDTVLCPEKYVLHVMEHFLRRYAHIDGVEVDLIQHRWSRIALDADADGRPLPSLQPHKHSFIRDGNDVRTVRAYASRDGASRRGVVRYLKGGIKDLVVLKSSGSAFYGFLRDEYTTLPEVQDRIFSTAVDCEYAYSLPAAKPIDELLQAPAKLLPDFCAASSRAVAHVTHTFATHSSPSVQATLFKTAERILDDGACQAVADVELTMPNRHYIPIDLKWAGVENLKEDQAEVFLPTAHPSGLIRAKIARGDGGSKAKL
ncbi:putative urate oxidase [Acaromyces ingoldii]|uniref:Uricase n=1 Tax=Acaromyces ingoldii TaxID=215250 RepID=A0A316YU20_9BASI|nr:putative urate oxidase [Acaromyces ingoldii]PWN91215.1 putative urate oxidase [Acaromyces ingoldii]